MKKVRIISQFLVVVTCLLLISLVFLSDTKEDAQEEPTEMNFKSLYFQPIVFLDKDKKNHEVDVYISSLSKDESKAYIMFLSKKYDYVIGIQFHENGEKIGEKLYSKQICFENKPLLIELDLKDRQKLKKIIQMRYLSKEFKVSTVSTIRK